MMAASKFFCDDKALDPAFKAHLTSLYTCADIKEQAQDWANHFAEDGIMSKAGWAANGRDGRFSLTS